jgi:hypothetical protein
MSRMSRQILLIWLPWALRIERLREKGDEGRVFQMPHGLEQVLVLNANQETLSFNKPIDANLPGHKAFPPSEEEIRMEWKFAAVVVDKLALFSSILFAIVSTVLLLVSSMCSNKNENS